jgi:hypothetical protein
LSSFAGRQCLMQSAASFQQYGQSVLRVPVSFILCARCSPAVRPRSTLTPCQWQHKLEHAGPLLRPSVWEDNASLVGAECDCGGAAGRDYDTCMCRCMCHRIVPSCYNFFHVYF